MKPFLLKCWRNPLNTLAAALSLPLSAGYFAEGKYLLGACWAVNVIIQFGMISWPGRRR